MTRAAVLAVALLLSGCMVGPTYRAPAPSLAPAFRGGPPGPSAARTAPFWRAFDDPVLNGLEDRALAQNLDLAAAAARVGQARAAAHAAVAALLPAAEADTQDARAYSSTKGTTGYLSQFPQYKRTASLYDVTAGASWEIDVFGGQRREAQAARAELAAAGADVAGARLMVTADVADAYIQLRGFQRRLALAESQVAADRRLLELVRYRFEEGQASRREADASEASLQTALATLPLLKMGAEAQMNRLAVLAGAPPEAARGALESPATIPLARGLEPGAPGDLLRTRPDLIAAERKLAAANAKVGAAIAGYYPRVSLQSLLGWDSTSTAALFTSPAAEAQGALGIKWRLFDFGRVDAEVANARGAEAAALAGWRQAVLRACEDVENALTARLQRADQARALHLAEAALQRSRQAAADGYAAGTLSLLEVTDADRQLLSVQDQAAQADADSARAAVALARALGG